MTFHPTMRKMVERVRPMLPEKSSVIEFGNQRFTAGRDFRSTKDFYESLGISYSAVDVNERMDSFILDLNEIHANPPTADLITNNGTSEHIFNQWAVFENAHNMCRKLMLHILPLTPWINHGFFNYNPILFRDLAAANSYTPVFTGIANRERHVIELGPEGFVEKRPEELIRKIRSISGEVFVISVLEKHGNEPFKMPFQGKYKKDIDERKLQSRYLA